MNLKTGIIALVVVASLLAVAPTASATCAQPYNEQEMVECAASQAISNGWTLVWDAVDCLTGGPCNILLPEN